jgi:hypothetical protein
MASRQIGARRTDSSPDWSAVFDRYAVQFLILDTDHDRDLYEIVRSQPGWRIDFSDGQSILLARTGKRDDLSIETGARVGKTVET